MRNETRVGVVVGLLVVVVTSVYFYGSSREDEDVLVGLGRRGSASTASILDSGSNPSAALPPPTVKPAPEPVRTVQPTAPTLFATDKSREARKPVPTPPSPEPEDTLLANATPSRRSELPPLNPSPLPLRSGSSDLLDEATRRNLEPDASDSAVPNKPAMLDLTSIGDRIRRNESSASPAIDSGSPITPAVRSRPPAPPPIDANDSVNIGGVVANQPPPSIGDGWPKQHRVEYGETLYGISVQYYGRSAGTSAILKANPGVKSPKSLREGQTLIIPAPDAMPIAMVAAAPAPIPAGRTPYLVRDGDSFYTIAKRVFNDGKRWEEIYEMNKALVKNSPKRLRPGMTIMVPAQR